MYDNEWQISQFRSLAETPVVSLSNRSMEVTIPKTLLELQTALPYVSQETLTSLFPNDIKLPFVAPKVQEMRGPESYANHLSLAQQDRMATFVPIQPLNKPNLDKESAFWVQAIRNKR